MEPNSFAYWNSNSRVNEPVLILGQNDTTYAVQSKGHVYVVPKANISVERKSAVPPVPPVIIAPRPEDCYLVLLTAEQRSEIVAYGLGRSGPWNIIANELCRQPHSGAYTNEWFWLWPACVKEILNHYGYDRHKFESLFESYLPLGAGHKVVVRQLWEEKLRREGIVPR